MASNLGLRYHSKKTPLRPLNHKGAFATQGRKTTHFCEKWDALKSVKYVSAAHINHGRRLHHRGARAGRAIPIGVFPSLSARRFFLRSRPNQCGRKRKLIQGFE